MEDDRIPRVDRLERDVARLEAELLALRSRIDEQEHSARSHAWAPPQTGGSSGVPEWQSTPAARQQRVSKPLGLPASETVLKWGGVALVVLAVGFAVSTAISRNWIGPELQLAGAVAVSFAMIGAGLKLRASRPGWMHALCTGGVLALYTTVASDLFVDQATTAPAFVATVVIGVGSLLLARSIRSEWVGAAALLGGAIGWAVIADHEFSFVATLIWFIALVAVTIAVCIERRWFAVRASAHTVGLFAVLILAGEAHGGTEKTLVLVATVIIASSLFVVPSIGDLSSVWQRIETQLAILTPPWAFGVAIAVGLESRSDNTIALVALAIAAATVVVVAGARNRLRHPHVISLIVGASITTSIGFAILLSASGVFLALAIQAAGLVFLSQALGRDVRVLVNAAILGLIAAIYVIDSMVSAWSFDDSLGNDITHLLTVVALAVGVWEIRQQLARRIGAVAMLAMVLVWLGSAFVHLPQGQAVVSIAWAALGTLVFLGGAARRRPDVAAVGLAVLALTVAKLLTVDLREVDALWRAALFFAVGLGLMRLGFLVPRLARHENSGNEAAPDRGVDETPALPAERDV